MQLTAAGLPAEITWNNYFQISTDVLFGAKGRIISLILFFLFFIFLGGLESHMEVIITWASGRDSRAESKNRFFSLLLFQ